MSPLLDWWQVWALVIGPPMLWLMLEALVFPPADRRPIRERARTLVSRLALEAEYAWWQRAHQRALARYRDALESGTRREVERAEQRLRELLNVRMWNG